MLEEHNDAPRHGFIFGVLVGILVALLFITKKGRNLLKVVTAEGKRKIANWDDLIEILQNEVGSDEEPESVIGEELGDRAKASNSSRKKDDQDSSAKQKANDEQEDEGAKVDKIPDTSYLERIDVRHLEQNIKEDKKEIVDRLNKIESEIGGKNEDILDSTDQSVKKKSRRLFRGVRKK